MDENELEEWRAKRLEQMQSEGKGGNAGVSKENLEQQRKAQEDMKHVILSQILSQSARARLNTLMVGKPEKGKMIETMLVRMAQSGQIMGKLQEQDLISMLERFNETSSAQKNVTVKFDRRRAALDDSDDDL